MAIYVIYYHVLMRAGAALKTGDLDRAAEQVEAAFAAEPRLRREARQMPQTLEELMPLLRRKDGRGADASLAGLGWRTRRAGD